MILSAVSLFRKFNTKTPLGASEWGIEENHGIRTSHVSFSGHASVDGSVRIYARYGRPMGAGKKPAIIFLADAGRTIDEDVFEYFLNKGYAVLIPDYTGKMDTDKEGTLRTVYPESLKHGNYQQARGLKEMEGFAPEETTWFEWTYVALFAVEFLKSREEIGNIGVVGVQKGGDVAWHTLLSPDVQCGVPVNSVGWHNFAEIAKFGDDVAHNLSDDEHTYIASVEAQSYAPYVKCPVLMLCALHDPSFDCDRAYDTYSRLALKEGNALVYSSSSGACIGLNALTSMSLFLERNLKGREIYVPHTLNVNLKEEKGALVVDVECDKEGILEEVGIFYAEADVHTQCSFRDWHRVYKAHGKTVKNGEFSHVIKPFAGASAAFVYAYARYINGFRVMSKITAKRLTPDKTAVKNKMLYSGKELDVFGVKEYKDCSIGNVFLEQESAVRTVAGYGGVKGAYCLGGMSTYKICSPQFLPDENAYLKFDTYFFQNGVVKVTIDVGDVQTSVERYSYEAEVKGGGKWKRMILQASDFKGETTKKPLKSFALGKMLSFDSEEEQLFAITNILWL